MSYETKERVQERYIFSEQLDRRFTIADLGDLSWSELQVLSAEISEAILSMHQQEERARERERYGIKPEPSWVQKLKTKRAVYLNFSKSLSAEYDRRKIKDLAKAIAEEQAAVSGGDISKLSRESFVKLRKQEVFEQLLTEEIGKERVNKLKSIAEATAKLDFIDQD